VAWAIDVPPEIPPVALGQYLAPWSNGGAAKDSTGTSVILGLRDAPGSAAPPAQHMADLALRMLYGTEAGASGFVVAQSPPAVAAEQTGSGTGTTTAPAFPDSFDDQVLVGVFASVAHRLDGRHVVGRVNLGPGLECLVFDGKLGGRGMLAAWARSAAPEPTVVNMYLGPAPQAVDVFGNRIDVPLVDGKHRLQVGTLPMFVEGVDANLAMFRAGFGVAPAFLESTLAPQTCTMILRNPWTRPISGSVVLVTPPGWKVEPRRIVFSIAPGESLQTALDVSLPISEVLGPKVLAARVDLTTDQRLTLDLSAPLEVGSKAVKFDATLATPRNARTGQTDAVVTQTITNLSAEPVVLYAFASLPGVPRQEQALPELPPGASVVRHFRFANVELIPQPADLRIGVRDASGPLVLNRTLAIPPTAGH
jgi:hypothetical protein